MKNAKNSFTGNFRKHWACAVLLCDPFDIILQKEDIVPYLITELLSVALAPYGRSHQRLPQCQQEQW